MSTAVFVAAPASISRSSCSNLAPPSSWSAWIDFFTASGSFATRPSITAEDRAHILHYDYNDVASLERAADEAGRDLAAVLVTAFRHDVKRHQEAPTLAFAQAVRRICDAAGAALVLDDVRAGFCLHIGGSWPYGVRPDLCGWSKAIANGHPAQ